MVLPGRRRTGTLPLMLALFCLLISTASAASAVLGIDLGTSFLKGVLVKPGIPFEIVLSKDTKRKETAAVAFKTPRTPFPSTGSAFPERAYGSDALALNARFPADVYPNLKPLLGQRIFDGSEGTAEYKRWRPALDMQGLAGRWTVGFRSPSFDDAAEPFAVEELLAMELKNLRENAEELAGKSSLITDTVITVPAYYTAAEKRAVELAAELAGLKVLALISDGLAVGLNYATSRTFPSVSDGAKPEYHMVFDMGAGSTTATVMRFQGRTVKDVGRFNKTVQEVEVMGTGWDKTLGGDELNGLIVDDIIDKFVQDPAAKKAWVLAEDVKRHGRTMARLWKDAEKVRQVLSANQASDASFEDLFDEVDFRYKITRQQFEDMAVEYAARVEGPVKQALEAAGLTFGDLDSVILHGGAIRTPFIQKSLESLAGDASKLRSNVNADEAAVFGAAFKGASLSPSFRVKEIRDIDVANHYVGLRYQLNGKDRSQKLFTPTSKLGTAKEMPFKNLADFDFSLYQQLTDGSEQPIFNVKTDNLTQIVSVLVEKEGCIKEEISTKFSIKLDPVFGLPSVIRSELSCEVDEKKGSVVDGVKDFFGFGSKDGKQEPLKDDAEGEQATEKITPDVTETSDKASTTPAYAAPSATPSRKPEEAKAPKRKTITRQVSLTVTRTGFEKVSKEEMKRMKDRLRAFDASDRARLAREAALNELEALTYRSRDLLEDEDFNAASTEEQRVAVESQLHEISDWLSAEGVNADEKTLKAKHAALKELLDPVVARVTEATRRPEAVAKLQDLLESSKSTMEMIRNSIEKIAAAESSAAAATASATSASASSSTTSSAAAASPSSSGDPLSDLEEDLPPSDDKAAPKDPNPEKIDSIFTADELKHLITQYDAVGAWLESKVAEQAKLSPLDEPVLTTTELQSKEKELSDIIVNLARKQYYNEAKKASGGSGGKKSGGSRGAKKNKTTAAKRKEEKSKKAAEEEEAAAAADGGENVEQDGENEIETPEHGEL